MKTDDLISILATGGAAVDPRAGRRRYAAAIGVALSSATLLMIALLGVRPDLAEAARLPMFWVKLAFPVALAAAALVTLQRLARPGARLGRAPLALAAPVIAVWFLAAAALGGPVASPRDELLFGATWIACLASISLLSVPGLIATFWAVRGFAPTRPALAGAAGGLFAGALAAGVYALHCDEMTAPFVATWYLLGMLVPTAVGAIGGARLLRW